VSVLIVARLSFQEARQRRLLTIILLLGLAFLVLYAVGFHYYTEESTFSQVGERFEITNFLIISALYAVNFLGIVLAVVLSVDTIAGDVASGAIHTVVTKPLRRWEVVLGKWLGLSLLLNLIIVAIVGAMLAISWLMAGYLPPNVGQGLGLIVLAELVLLTLSILGGTRLNTLANGVLMLMLYGLAFISGWIEQIGAFTGNETAVDVGILISLVMPSEAMWRRAAYLMQPPFVRDLGATPFLTMTAPSTGMVVYTLAYVALALLAAIRLFDRRDL